MLVENELAACSRESHLAYSKFSAQRDGPKRGPSVPSLFPALDPLEDTLKALKIFYIKVYP